MEGGKLNRREFLQWGGKAALAAVVSKALTACATAPREAPETKAFEDMEGKYVPVREILSQPIPAEEWGNLIEAAKELPVVVIVDKGRKLYGMYVNGKLERIGAAGTARTEAGYITTDGLHQITRLEGPGYTSKEYPGAKMDNASFFGHKGRAIHASANFVFRRNPKTGEREWYIVLDNSHGCVNVMDEDAEVINHTIKNHGSRAAVLVY